MFNSYIERNRDMIIDDLFRFIRIPSISMTGQGIAEAVSFLAGELAAAGCEVKIYDTTGNPIIYAETGPENASFTLLIYGHYDVFPADDQKHWKTQPFEPTVEGDRIYGRGAGDNKGQIMAHIQAIRMYKQVLGELPVKIKFVIEGEEETGSKSLPVFVTEHRAELRADFCYYSDGPMFPDDQPVLLFGVRGVAYVEFIARGARRVLHSGNFGGIAPNPIFDLCRLFSQMVAPDGRILVPGIENGVPELTSLEREALEALPIDRERMLSEMGVAPITDRFGQNLYERLLCRPNFNIAGLSGGHSGEGAKTIIPNEAIAKVDIRLVGDQNPDHVIECLRNFIRENGFDRIEVRKLVGQPASKTALDHPFAKVVREAVIQGFGCEPLLVPSLGGTTPDYVFTKILKIPSIVVPYAPHDENNHAPNESTKVSIYLNGIKTTAHLLASFT
jgi:acetylornithine deacetylase/succinyl-diaminopimelate desuccinylase-like protein